MPAVVRHADDRDSLLLALVENVAREQLTPVEEARAYAVLMDEFVLTLGDVAAKVGRSKPSVANRLRLLDLPDDVLGMVERGELSEGHARAVLAVPDQEDRQNSRASSSAVASPCGRQSRLPDGPARSSAPAGRRPRSTRHWSSGTRTAAERVLGKPVKVGRGKIEIAFADEHELAEIAEALEQAAGAMIAR